MKAHRETLGHWLIQRMTAASLIPTILISNVSTLILLNISLFWHIQIWFFVFCFLKNFIII